MHGQVVVLGATGQAGRRICRLLLEREAVDVVACGRRPERIEELAAYLGNSPRLSVHAVDVADEGALAPLVQPGDVVVGATGSWHDGPLLARRAVRASASYVGIYMSNPAKWRALRSLDGEARARGVALVDDGGTHPGLPGAMIRLAAARAPLAAAWVGAKFCVRWSDLGLAPETIRDFVAELRNADPSFRADGDWQRGYRHARRFDFGREMGVAACVPMLIEEIREAAAALPALRSCGFFVAGFGPWTDWGVLPAAILLGRVHAGAAARLVWWGLRRFESGEEHSALVLEGRCTDGSSVRMQVGHEDAYEMTAVPVVAAIRQLLARGPTGVWTQASFVEPGPFFDDLQAMGIRVTTSWKGPPARREAGDARPGAQGSEQSR